MTTKIEWAQETWNPVTGCTPVSEGCANCYAKRMATRMRGRCGYPADDPFRVTFHLDRLEIPMRWKRPRMVFVCSMGDLFHGYLSIASICQVFGAAKEATQHKYLFLTKRPGAMRAAMSFFFGEEPMPANWWLGVTAENQNMADKRIPILLQIPAAVRFVSIEPMLGPVNLSHMDVEKAGDPEWCWINALTGKQTDMGRPCEPVPSLDWVICGGESGPGARPMHQDWARSLRDQCVAAGVPFFMKQMSKKQPIPGDLFIREYPNERAGD